MSFFKDNFYWIDFCIGASMPIIAFLLYKTRRIDRYTWVLFWIGAALGMTWELPMSLLNEYSSTHAVAKFIRPMPTHFSVIIVTHSFWDGGLFLAGVWIVRKICREPVFESFRIQELSVLLIWGQTSELAVELTSTFNHAWAFIPRWWNPSLFNFNGSDITLLPQLIWIAAPLVFYIIAVKIKPILSTG